MESSDEDDESSLEEEEDDEDDEVEEDDEDDEEVVEEVELDVEELSSTLDVVVESPPTQLAKGAVPTKVRPAINAKNFLFLII